MPNEFKDTFFKNEGKDNLQYDDPASYFFLSTLLICTLPCFSYCYVASIFKKKHKSFVQAEASDKIPKHCNCSICKKKLQNPYSLERRQSFISKLRLGKAIQLVLLIAFWIALFWLLQQAINNSKELKQFDPFSILEINEDASDSEIKAAYKLLSKKYHPDLNKDDPNAQAKFIQINKAYEALTDKVAKENYRLYGNPDGPTAMKIGIGLPKFLLQRENMFPVVIVMVVVILGVIIVLYCIANQHYKFENGIMIDTHRILIHKMNENLNPKSCVELFAHAFE